jgi:hypothetical protein
VTALDLIPTLLTRSDMPPGVRAFLADLARQAKRRPLSPRQVQAVRRIAAVPPPPDYAGINRAARANAEAVCRRLLPKGVRVGSEWVCGDLSGAKGQSLRVELTGSGAGRWIDFSTGDRGGDFVSLAAAVKKMPHADAARGLAQMLGVPAEGGARHD